MTVALNAAQHNLTLQLYFITTMSLRFDRTEIIVGCLFHDGHVNNGQRVYAVSTKMDIIFCRYPSFANTQVVHVLQFKTITMSLKMI